MTRLRTEREAERQHERGRDGRYSRMHRCEVCRRPAGDRRASYYSDERCNRFGRGLELCFRCARRLESVPDDQYLEQFP